MQISEEHKDIIGTYGTNGNPKKWPLVNFAGGRYNRPAPTQKISAEYFVVLPAGFKDWDAVKAIKEQYGGIAPAAPVKVGRNEKAAE